MLRDFPTGPYRWTTFGAIPYKGWPIQAGIYEVVLTSPENEIIPLIQTNVDGNVSIGNLDNYQCKITSLELEEAYKRGYEIILI